MNERDKLIRLLEESGMIEGTSRCNIVADELLENGVIVPPCKIDDTVWKIEDVWHLDNREGWIYHYEKEVVEFKVRSISISCNSKGTWTKKIRICEVRDGKIIDHQRNIEFNEFGKTVFFTREEAEHELKRIQEGERQ